MSKTSAKKSSKYIYIYIYNIINLIIIVKVQHADGDARGRGDGRQGWETNLVMMVFLTKNEKVPSLLFYVNVWIKISY